MQLHEVGHSYTLSHTPTGTTFFYAIMLKLSLQMIYRHYESRL